jgi:hypothetical protein
MITSVGRLLLLTASAVVVVGSPPRGSSTLCGNCDPGWYWDGVSDGAYRFDANVPDYVKEATYWADDDWGAHYHDEGNQDGIVIGIANLPPGTNGVYDANNNTLYIAQAVLDDCPDGCNLLISVIAHELGHSLGFDDIQGGCESSIMSWDRNRHVVIGPSEEDLCWFSNPSGGGGGGGGGCFPYCEDRSGIPLQVDYDSAPVSWRESFDRAELVAVIRLQDRDTRDVGTELPLSHFSAEVMEVIKGSGEVRTGSTITVTRFGGMRVLADGLRLVEERRFDRFSVGQTLLVFLSWFEGTHSYTLPSGPQGAFDLDLRASRARSFARSGFAAIHHGRSVGSLLTEVRAAR